MPNLTETLTSDTKKSAVVEDCLALIDAEVADKGGLTGLAIKAGYKTVQGIKPGFVKQVVTDLLPEFAKALDPLWLPRRKAQGKNVRQHFDANATRVADALLGITDEKAKRSKSGDGQGHVREAPRQREEERRGRGAAARRDDREARVMTGGAPPGWGAAAIDSALLGPGKAPSSSRRPGSRRTSRSAEGDALCVLDVRGLVRPPGSKPRYLPKRDEYDAGHIPGAVFVDWTRDIVDPDDPVPVQIAGPSARSRRSWRRSAWASHARRRLRRLRPRLRGAPRVGAALLRARRGAPPRRRLGAVGGGGTAHDARRSPARRPAVFTSRARGALRRTADDVEHALGKPDVLLIDARPADQYAGKVSAATRSGHIPGALNVPYATLSTRAPDRFRGAPELRAAFAAGGGGRRRPPA